MKNKIMVSIGLPVYNGEDYLLKALDSILIQDYDDMEIIICDNASTDRTKEIALFYMKKDNRIKYYRNPKNYGASYNFNKVFNLSRGKYFKWAAHDDTLSPSFIKKCVSVLECDRNIVVCYSKTKKIDFEGNIIGTYTINLLWDSKITSKRFKEAILKPHPCIAIFGLIRREVLLKTSLIKPFFGSDRNLLAEISLLGRLYEIPEYLFYRRDHQKTSVRKYDAYERISWFDPLLRNEKVFPFWKNFVQYFLTIVNVKTDLITKFNCYVYLLLWFLREYRSLGGDLKRAISLKKS